MAMTLFTCNLHDKKDYMKEYRQRPYVKEKRKDKKPN